VAGEPDARVVRRGSESPAPRPRNPALIATAPLAAERTALLLIDAREEHFIPGGPHEVPGAERALRNAARLLRRARRVGMHVVHVRHVGGDPVLDGVRPDGPGSGVRPEVSPSLGEPVIEPHGAGAFDGTPLAERLDELGVDTVIVAGVTSCGGCTVTAREALGLRLRTLVAADAIAAEPEGGVAPEDVHGRALDVQRRLGAEVLSSGTIKSLLGWYG
jgi:nicotinamidase-related amidase